MCSFARRGGNGPFCAPAQAQRPRGPTGGLPPFARSCASKANLALARPTLRQQEGLALTRRSCFGKSSFAQSKANFAARRIDIGRGVRYTFVTAFPPVFGRRRRWKTFQPTPTSRGKAPGRNCQKSDKKPPFPQAFSTFCTAGRVFHPFAPSCKRGKRGKFNSFNGVFNNPDDLAIYTGSRWPFRFCRCIHG